MENSSNTSPTGLSNHELDAILKKHRFTERNLKFVALLIYIGALISIVYCFISVHQLFGMLSESNGKWSDDAVVLFADALISIILFFFYIYVGNGLWKFKESVRIPAVILISIEASFFLNTENILFFSSDNWGIGDALFLVGIIMLIVCLFAYMYYIVLNKKSQYVFSEEFHRIVDYSKRIVKTSFFDVTENDGVRFTVYYRELKYPSPRGDRDFFEFAKGYELLAVGLPDTSLDLNTPTSESVTHTVPGCKGLLEVDVVAHPELSGGYKIDGLPSPLIHVHKQPARALGGLFGYGPLLDWEAQDMYNAFLKNGTPRWVGLLGCLIMLGFFLYTSPDDSGPKWLMYWIGLILFPVFAFQRIRRFFAQEELTHDSESID